MRPELRTAAVMAVWGSLISAEMGLGARFGGVGKGAREVEKLRLRGI